VAERVAGCGATGGSIERTNLELAMADVRREPTTSRPGYRSTDDERDRRAAADRTAATAATPGSVPAAARPTVERDAIIQRAAFIAPRDSVRWGPIVAGLVTALSTFLLLSLLAIGLGVAAADTANAGEEVAPAAGIIAAAIGLLSFLIGGYVAGRAAAVSGRGAGALNGFLVWALGITAILVLSALGLSQLFGAAGDIFGQVQQSNVDPNVQVNPDQAADAIRNSALIGFGSLALPALAAALGGALGARDEDEVVETV
jgi:hypothetical protein